MKIRARVPQRLPKRVAPDPFRSSSSSRSSSRLEIRGGIGVLETKGGEDVGSGFLVPFEVDAADSEVESVRRGRGVS